MFVRRFVCTEDGLIDSTRGTSRIIVTWLEVGLAWLGIRLGVWCLSVFLCPVCMYLYAIARALTE